MAPRRFDALLETYGDRVVAEYLDAKARGVSSPVVTLHCDLDGTDPGRVDLRVDDRMKAAVLLELESPEAATEVRKVPPASRPITLVIRASEGCLVVHRELP
jgi:hypothetical protein